MLIFRLVLIVFFILFIYLFLRYLFNPKRKLELAHEKQAFYLLDDFHNVRKNLLITHRGVLFEGEKYLGTAENAFRVVHIKLWPHKKEALHGLNVKDFEYIEQKIFEQYPYSTIEWSNPINELLKKERRD